MKTIVEFIKLFNVGDKWAHALAITPIVFGLGFSLAIICYSFHSWVQNELAKEKLIEEMRQQLIDMAWKQDKTIVCVADVSRCFAFFAKNQQMADSLRNQPEKVKALRQSTESYLKEFLPHPKIDSDTTIRRFSIKITPLKKLKHYHCF